VFFAAVKERARLEDARMKLAHEVRSRRERQDMEKREVVLRYLGKISTLVSESKTASLDILPTIGSASHVPRFLRTAGKARNRNFSKMQTERMIKEIWQAREKILERLAKRKPPEMWGPGGNGNTLGDAAYSYLQTKFGSPGQIAEVGYSLVFGAWKYQFDADCELFLKILTGEVVESVQEEEKDLQRDIIKLFKSLAGRGGCGVSIEDAEEGLHRLFRVGQGGGKTRAQFTEVMAALRKEVGEFVADPCALFREDENFNQGPFAEAVRDQYLAESVEYYKRLERSLGSLSDVDGFVGEAGIAKALSSAQAGLTVETARVLARILLNGKQQIHTSLCVHRVKDKGRKYLSAMLLRKGGPSDMATLGNDEGARARFKEHAKRAQVLGVVRDVVAAVRLKRAGKRGRTHPPSLTPEDSDVSSRPSGDEPQADRESGSESGSESDISQQELERSWPSMQRGRAW